MHTCNNCLSPVSRDFARVFGNSHDEVMRCPCCAEMTAIKAGHGALASAPRRRGPWTQH